MFTRPTVFIIGAGASSEIGLPVGSRLKADIANSLAFRFDWNKQLSDDPSLYQALKKRFREHHGEYSKAGHEFAKVVSSFVSIDEALHYYSDCPAIVQLGKLAIATNIIQAERSSLLYSEEGRSKLNLNAVEKAW